MNLNKDILIAALKRALWTFLQTAIGMIPVGARIIEVGWLDILSVCTVAAIVSFAKSLVVGMPESDVAGVMHIDTSDPETDKYQIEMYQLEGLSAKKTVQLKIDGNAKLDDVETKYIGE